MPYTSNADRNIYIHDARGATIAGMHQFGPTTFADLHHYLSICLVSPETFSIRRDHDGRIFNAGSIATAEIGGYTILGPDGIPAEVELSTDCVRPRVLSSSLSHATTPGISAFRDRVRARDGRCVVTGTVRRGFMSQDAAHIIPKAHINHWISAGLHNYITDTQTPSRGMGINSVQNGVLLNTDIHRMWDTYGVAIHPTTHRIVFFGDYPEAYLYNDMPSYLPPADTAPPSKLLEEHFRQCVLANIRGASGEVFIPDYDTDEGETWEGVGCGNAWARGNGKTWMETMLWEKLGVVDCEASCKRRRALGE